MVILFTLCNVTTPSSITNRNTNLDTDINNPMIRYHQFNENIW